jgi:hypothetical protein
LCPHDAFVSITPSKIPYGEFPHYGFKADFSDDAFLSAALLTPARSIHIATRQFAFIIRIPSSSSRESGQAGPSNPG